MHNFVEFECPLLLLIVYDSLCVIFRHAKSDHLKNEMLCFHEFTYLCILVNVDVFAGKVRSGSRPDHDFNRFFFHHISFLLSVTSENYNSF